MKSRILELSRLCAPSGFEQAVTDYCAALFPNADTRTDSLGNLIVHRPGNGKRVAFVCGTDDQGVFLIRRKENGEFYCAPLGGTKAKALCDRPLRLQNGGIAAVSCRKEEPDFSDLTVSLLCGEAMCGEWGSVMGECTADETSVHGVGAARSACCAILTRLAENSPEDCDAYFIFSSRYRSGKKGALAALSVLQPSLAVMLEPFSVGDSSVIETEKGAAAALHYGSFLDFFDLPKRLEGCGLPYQLLVSEKAQIVGKMPMIFGIPSVLICLPCRETDAFDQTVYDSDVTNTYDLLKELWKRC